MKFVDIDSETSAREPVIACVPQGSISGSLQFLVYINDIVRCTDNATFVLYADERTVVTTGNL